MPVTALLKRWYNDPSIADNLVARRVFPARQARYVPLPEELHPSLKYALLRLGITSLYAHQAQAYAWAQEGKHLVVSTTTASGKSLCYILPVVDAALKHPTSCALFLFPTKALAQDQKDHLTKLSDADDLKNVSSLPAIAIYDGDTPQHHRRAIRDNVRLLISNADMLHLGILPQHTLWARFLSHLRYVVLDEMHVYRGVFGSHVSNVMRRLKRIAHHYGSQPQFILTSATIANPSELAEKLIEHPVHLIQEDASQRGAQTFLLYNPPLVHPELGIRRSALQESLRLAEDLLAHHIQSVIFVPSRHGVEMALTYLRQRLREASWFASPSKGAPRQPENLIHGYRSGYLPAERRAIERQLRAGEIRIVIATNALELGIDIGQMHASLMVSYPGSIASTLQQAGRAGRTQEDSLAVLVASASPLDQYLVRHPQYLFDASVEHALINPNNPLILLAHIQCAAFELPFNENDGYGNLSAEEFREYLHLLREQGVLHASNGRFFWMADRYPAEGISLRSISGSPVLLQIPSHQKWETIGQVDYLSAHWMVHPNAIYLHQGQTYLVDELDLEHRVAYLHEVQCDYFTEPLQETQIQLLNEMEHAQAIGATRHYGEIKVTTQWSGFRKVRFFTHEILGTESLNLPAVDLITTAYWLALEAETVENLRLAGLWSNDPNDYGPNWAHQRRAARQRDGFRCRHCNQPEGSRQHDVHHLVPFRAFSSYLQANALENLVTLCPACHQKAELAVRVRSGLSGLAYILNRLAPLFVLCDPQDLAAHADPHSPLGEGRAVVAIYDRIPAGIGLARRLYDEHYSILEAARELILGCACEDGCPSCTGPAGEGGMGSKRETLAILESLIASPSSP